MLPTDRLSGIDIPGELPSMKGLNLTDRIDEQIRGLGERLKVYRAQAGRLPAIQRRPLRRLGGFEIPNQVRDDGKAIDQLTDAQAAQLAELKELGAQTKELEAGSF